MAVKDIRLGTDARERMLHGIDILANAVRVTFTASARMSTPRSMRVRASTLNLTSFAAIVL